MKDKMGIWNAVCTTDPKYTKKVNQRGGFTAIDAQYQIQTATEMFGAFGLGWGVKDETFNIIDSMVIYQAILWYLVDGIAEEGEIPIHSSLAVKPDCIKAVATDALTKGLSKLGFNADVFLGKFDDNKYVQEQSSKVLTKDDGDLFPQEQAVKPSNGDGSVLWPFNGKYKGQPVTALDQSYCTWALNTHEQLKESNHALLRSAVESHLQSFS